MARAGYEPRQMANMFQTIQQQGGGGGPEWLSDHPDPGNRYAAINREAASLTVSGTANTGAAFDRSGRGSRACRRHRHPRRLRGANPRAGIRPQDQGITKSSPELLTVSGVLDD